MPRAVQAEFGQAHLHRGGDVGRHGAFQRKERQLPERLRAGVENFDGFDPRRFWAVVDFAQVENRPLHPLAVRRADLFDEAPVAVILAVFEPVMRV